VKISRRQLRKLIREAADAHAVIGKLMSDGEVNQALSLASSLGIPLEELPWDVPDEVLAQGMKAVLSHMMVRRTGSTDYFQETFKKIFAIAEELGIMTEDLPWDLDSVTDYLDPYHQTLIDHQYQASRKGSGVIPIPPDEIDEMLDKHLEPTGWSIDYWVKENKREYEEWLAANPTGAD